MEQLDEEPFLHLRVRADDPNAVKYSGRFDLELLNEGGQGFLPRIVSPAQPKVDEQGNETARCRHAKENGDIVIEGLSAKGYREVLDVLRTEVGRTQKRIADAILDALNWLINPLETFEKSLGEQLAVQKLESDVLNGGWIPAENIAQNILLDTPGSKLTDLQPINHYEDDIRRHNAPQRVADFIMQLSDPAAVQAYDALVDQFNADLERVKQATDIEATAQAVSDFIQMAKGVACEKRPPEATVEGLKEMVDRTIKDMRAIAALSAKKKAARKNPWTVEFENRVSNVRQCLLLLPETHGILPRKFTQCMQRLEALEAKRTQLIVEAAGDFNPSAEVTKGLLGLLQNIVQ